MNAATFARLWFRDNLLLRLLNDNLIFLIRGAVTVLERSEPVDRCCRLVFAEYRLIAVVVTTYRFTELVLLFPEGRSDAAAGRVGASVRSVTFLVAVLTLHVVEYATLSDVVSHLFTEGTCDVLGASVSVLSGSAVRHTVTIDSSR